MYIVQNQQQMLINTYSQSTGLHFPCHPNVNTYFIKKKS